MGGSIRDLTSGASCASVWFMSSHIIIQNDFYRGRQSLELNRIREIDGLAVRVRIDRDSYDNQSTAVGEVMTEAGWKVVVSRPITALPIASFSYVTRDGDLDRAADAARMSADAIEDQVRKVMALGVVAA